jgi:hypothetical protein
VSFGHRLFPARRVPGRCRPSRKRFPSSRLAPSPAPGLAGVDMLRAQKGKRELTGVRPPAPDQRPVWAYNGNKLPAQPCAHQNGGDEYSRPGLPK